MGNARMHTGENGGGGETHGDDPGELGFDVEQFKTAIETALEKIGSAQLTLSNQYGKICIHGKPDTKYLVIEA